MDWKYVAPAIAAGLLSAAAFWWVTVRWLCAACEEGGGCTWNGACTGWVGGLLAAGLIAVAVVIPCRLVEGCWPRRRTPGDG